MKVDILLHQIYHAHMIVTKYSNIFIQSTCSQYKLMNLKLGEFQNLHQFSFEHSIGKFQPAGTQVHVYIGLQHFV